MNEDIIYTIIEYNFLLIGILFLLKCLLFALITSKRKTFKKFLFYSDESIHGTKTPKKKQQKKLQNAFSVIIFCLLVMQVFLLFSTVFFRHKVEE